MDEQLTTKRRWLIEAHPAPNQGGGILYYAGGKSTWTADAYQAHHYASKAEAEEVMADIHVLAGRTTEAVLHYFEEVKS